jgi:hypothetical protein
MNESDLREIRIMLQIITAILAGFVPVIFGIGCYVAEISKRMK